MDTFEWKIQPIFERQAFCYKGLGGDFIESESAVAAVVWCVYMPLKLWTGYSKDDKSGPQFLFSYVVIGGNKMKTFSQKLCIFRNININPT